MQRRLTLVPWEPTWLAHQTLDLSAIYRRPQRRRDSDTDRWEIVRDDEGFVVWDLTPGMTIRNHAAYLQKGMQYVTLASEEDVARAADPEIQPWGAVPLGRRAAHPGERPQDYVQQPTGVRGPWNVGVYLSDEAAAREERIARIRQHVVDQGPDYAEVYERQTDPDYVLPQKYRDVAQAAEADPAPVKRKRGRPRKHPRPDEEPVLA